MTRELLCKGEGCGKPLRGPRFYRKDDDGDEPAGPYCHKCWLRLCKSAVPQSEKSEYEYEESENQ